MPKVLAIGDSTINVFLQIPENSENINVDAAARTMNFRLGSKTQLQQEVVTVGGNALNVAVGLARQGIAVEFYSIVGGDVDGQRIVSFSDREIQNSEFRIQNYNLKLKINKTLGVKTNVGYIVNYKNERFILQDTSVKPYSFSSTDYRLQTTDWLFLSSVGPKYQDFFAEIIELKKKIGFRLAYNPSSNELARPVETYIETMKNCDALFVNRKEMEKILNIFVGVDLLVDPKSRGSATEDKPGGLSLQKLWELNKKLVVVTDGRRGSYAFDGKKTYFEPESGAEPIEKTGAGDAYESGFLAEYLKTGDIQKAMKNGTENAGSVIQKIGAVEGLQYKL